jgi:hypothetical protein
MKLLVLIIAGWITCVPFTNAAAPANPPGDQAEPTAFDRRYHFEHRLLPKWTYHSGGAFFRDMAEAKTDKLIEVAAEVVDQAYADSIKVTYFKESDRILISFIQPKAVPLCYHVLIVRTDDTYHFLTLEMTEDFLGRGSTSVFGKWTADGGHGNLGERTYSDGANFLKEADGLFPRNATGRNDTGAELPGRGPGPKSD